jgi:DNA-binding Xre family transcriptional regulator
MSSDFEFEQQMDKYSSETIEDLKEMMHQLRSTNIQLEANQVELEAKIARIEDELEMLREEKSGFQVRIADLEALCKGLESQIEDLNEFSKREEEESLVRFGARVASCEIEKQLLPDLYGLNDDLALLMLNQEVKFNGLMDKYEHLKSEFDAEMKSKLITRDQFVSTIIVDANEIQLQGNFFFRVVT